MTPIKQKHVVIGLSASVCLLIFYFLIASVFSGFSFAIDNFLRLKYWMIPLAIGFGLQLGMFFYTKEAMHAKATAQAAASTGISASAMVACCAHHLADIAPFLGIAATGVFLAKYQSTFLLLGLISNVLGIAYMTTLTQTEVSREKMKRVLYALLILSVLAVLISYYFTSKSSDTDKTIGWETRIDSQNDVEFKVKPISISEFEVVISTHSVELDFDLQKIALLYDDNGNSYEPIAWEGSPSGGHHREGVLIFPRSYYNAKTIKLVIMDGSLREFVWNINGDENNETKPGSYG